jgi:hypothetical protein
MIVAEAAEAAHNPKAAAQAAAHTLLITERTPERLLLLERISAVVVSNKHVTA